jgi:hypothetical protein
MDRRSANIRRVERVLSPREIRDNFGRRMAILREALEYRFVPEFAVHVGLTPASIYKYERGGTRLPRLDGPTYQKIRIATGATVDWLLYGNADSLPSELRKKISAYQRSQSGNGKS